GNLPKAGVEADGFLESALAISDPNLRALAWDMKARIAMAMKDWNGAAGYIQEALAILENFDIPMATWRIHATAWDLYCHMNDRVTALNHRARAQAVILNIANSFERGEPLKESFLNAATIRGVFA